MTIHRLYTVCVNKMYLHLYTDTHIYFIPVIFQIPCNKLFGKYIWGGGNLYASRNIWIFKDICFCTCLQDFTSIDVSEIP